MRWTWDPGKDVRNRAKHGLSLAVGEVGLSDPLAVTVPDEIHPDRYKTVCDVEGRTLVVIHTISDDDADTEAEIEGRIISVRCATSHERREYENAGN